VNTLFTSTIKEPKNLNKRRTKAPSKTVQIQITRAGKYAESSPIQSHTEPLLLELEEKMFKVKLTIIDTPGFGDYVNNRHGWIPIVDFLDDQHENYMRQEQQPCRKGVVDMRVHVCLYFVKPTGHT
jgi:septin family protein